VTAPVLETPRLRLRRLVAGDAGFVLEVLNDPSFIEFIGDRGVRDQAAARRYIEDGPAASHAQHGYGMDLVELKATAEPIGICGLVRRTWHELPEIGYAFLPRHRSAGYAYEAAAAVLSHALGALALPRVVAIVSPANAHSIRVLEKLGLRYECRVTPPGEQQAILQFTTVGAA
jgi:RimJ/RimL family protein N-acetyltransferase